MGDNKEATRHRKKKKTNVALKCKWSFLEILKQSFSECNLNVIVNVIGIFCGLSKFSHIDKYV